MALTDSTTMGLASLYDGLTLRARRRGADHDPRLLRHARGAAAGRPRATARRYEKSSLYDDPAAAVGRRDDRAAGGAIATGTRVVALTWVHSSTGVKLPVRAIADAWPRSTAAVPPPTGFCLRGRRARLAREDVARPELGCDFFVVRYAQVAVWAARHRHRLGRATGASQRSSRRFSGPRRRATTHAGRLPGLRAPLGDRRRRSRSTSPSAVTASRRAPSSRRAAQGGPGRRPQESASSRLPRPTSRPGSSASSSTG